MAYIYKHRKDYENEFDYRNNEAKDKMRIMYIHDATHMLMTTPFCYPEKISRETAEGIVNHGDILMYNADTEEDDDIEMNELNNLGNKFQSMQNCTWLFLHVDAEDHEKLEKLVKQSMKEVEYAKFNVKHERVQNLPECLNKLKDYVHYTASCGFSFLISFMGHYNEDGLELSNGTTIPRDIIEKQIKKLMYETTEFCPMTVYLLFFDNEDKLSMSVIDKERLSDDPERFILTQN